MAEQNTNDLSLAPLMNQDPPTEEEGAKVMEPLAQTYDRLGAVENPFKDQASPFGDPAAVTAPPGEKTPTPMRTLTAAMAMVGSDGTQPQSQDELVQAVQNNIDYAEKIIAQQGDYNLRLQSAVRQIQERTANLQKYGPDIYLSSGVNISKEQQDEMARTFAADNMANLEHLAKTALEEEALKNLETYMAAGDTMAVHVLLNKMNPDKNSTYGVIKNNLTKAMIISNAIEKAQLDENDESLVHSVLTAITSVPEMILLGDMFRKLGNVKDGEAGKTASSWLSKFFSPYGDYDKQINALQSMSAADLADYLPTFLENVKDNATTWGLTDPGTVQDILHDFQNGVSQEAMRTGNVFHWLDVAAFVPFARIGRGVARTTELVMGVGSRKAAADRVAAAIDETIQGGGQSTMRKFGIGQAEIEEHALPTAINPTKVPDNALTRKAAPEGRVARTKDRLLSSTSGAGRPPVPPRVSVSLSADVSDTMAAARVINERLKAMTPTFRHFTEDEINVAVKGVIEDVQRQTKSNIADYEVRQVPLESGQVIYQADVVIDKPFATADEAAGWLRNNGFGADVTNAIERQVASGSKIERAYHGTTKVFDQFDVSKTRFGENAVYFTDNADVANDYTKASSAGSPNVRPVNIDTSNLLEVDMKGASFNNPTLVEMNKAIQKAKAEGKDGVVFRNIDDAASSKFRKGSNVYALINPDIAKPGFGEVVEDVSGQFFPRVTVDVGEAGYYTHGLNVPKQFYASRWLLNPSQTSDTRLFEQGTKAGQLHTRMLKAVQRDLIKAFTKLNSSERTYLDQVLLKGVNMKKWFSDEEFNVLWERATGRVPSDNVQAAYRQYKINNDFEWLMRNAQVRTEYVIRGFKDVSVPAIKKDSFMGRVSTEPKLPDERIYDASEGVHYKKGSLTQEQLSEKVDQGYVMVHSEEAIKLHDGTEINNFLVKKTDLEVNPIRQNILEYTEGGHRLYAQKNFVKQARTFRQPDAPESGDILKSPNVFRTAATHQEASLWAETMNRARMAVLENNADARYLDTEIFKGQHLDFPTGEEFLAGVKSGDYSLDHPFEALFDRELPSIYSKTPEGARFADDVEGAAGFGGYYRTTGRLYYSHKGDHLRAVDGELSPTLDAFQSQSNALYNISRMSTFADYKTSAIHRWVNTYRQHLNFRNGADPTEIFNSSTISPVLDKSMANQIEGQRNAIQRVLNFRSDFDMHYENMLRGMHQWIAGTEDNALRRAVSKAPLYLMDRNPVNYLRGWAFDLKLGLFNIGQFAIQTSTMFSAMALSPRLGARGFLSYMPVQMYQNAIRLGTHENVLDLMVKRGMPKLTGFSSDKDFKDFIRFASDSGFLDFGNTHALVNNSGPASTFAIMNKVEAGREMGRFFFYQAEVANRIVALRIAYGEAMERFAGQGLKNREFEEFVRGRAENYAFNMSETSRSAWQKGLLSVPTQFWAYNIRMAEALVGKNFTNAQKLRLMLMQMGVAGTAGIPMLGWITDWANEETGHAPRFRATERDPRPAPDSLEQAKATFQRGLLDAGIYYFTGADVQWGAKWGTGDFFHQTVKDILGIGQYGPKSFADMTGGATYSIWGEAIGSGIEVAKYWASHESGGNDVNLSRFEMENLFRQVSTVNNVYFKAWFAHNYGIYQSMKGRTLVSDLPPATAPFVALGFAPGELRDREAIMAWRENKEETIKSSADFINRLWEESLREPDKMKTNARMVNEFINMVPEQYRKDVLNRAHLNKDPSDYDRLLRMRQTDQIIEDAAKLKGNEQ